MLGKRSRPIQRTQSRIFHLMTTDTNLTEKLLQPFFSAPRLLIGLTNNPPKPCYDYNDGSRSPTSPLDAAPCFGAAVNKPKAVGLGILAALTDGAGADEDKCKGNVVSPKNSISKMFCCSSSESVPIPVGRGAAMKEEEREDSLEFSESYTCVTMHGPASVTKQIYFDEEEFREPKKKAVAVFEASSFNEEPCFPVADFLSCCFLCRRPLSPGKDIFMYSREEKKLCEGGSDSENSAGSDSQSKSPGSAARAQGFEYRMDLVQQRQKAAAIMFVLLLLQLCVLLRKVRVLLVRAHERSPTVNHDLQRRNKLCRLYLTSDITCYEQLRMRIAPFQRLVARLRGYGLADSQFLSAEEQVAIFLSTVGHGIHYQRSGHNFIRSS